MEDVGITNGCAIIPVAKTRMTKLKVHSAILREMELLVALLLWTLETGGDGRGFFSFFRLMMRFFFYTAMWNLCYRAGGGLEAYSHRVQQRRHSSATV